MIAAGAPVCTTPSITFVYTSQNSDTGGPSQHDAGRCIMPGITCAGEMPMQCRSVHCILFSQLGGAVVVERA